MAEPLSRNDLAPAPEGGGGELRGAPRLTLLIRAAKILSPQGEYLCILRDASETGISVKLFHPLPPADPLLLEMPNGDRYDLQRVWETEGKAGFQFNTPADVLRLVEIPGHFAKRPVRVNVQVECRLLSISGSVDAIISNLSQGGALIRSDGKLALAQRVKIKAGGLPEIAARVRWRRGEYHGLVFEDTFQFAQLGEVLYELQAPLRKNA